MLSKGVSKLNLLEEIENESENTKILCVGDKGLWPGNDFELLNTPYSLSVDEVTKDPETCWNLSPIGHKGEQAVIDYLNSLRFAHQKFQFSFKKLKRLHHE